MDEQKNEPDLDISRYLEKLMPYRRQIIILSITILICLVVFLGWVYGSARVCNQVEGFLDSSFTCHPHYYSNISAQETPVYPMEWSNVSIGMVNG